MNFIFIQNHIIPQLNAYDHDYASSTTKRKQFKIIEITLFPTTLSDKFSYFNISTSLDVNKCNLITKGSHTNAPTCYITPATEL